jgi:hypothetical protein
LIQEISDKTKILMQLHFSRLAEKDRRQYAALESLRLGRGGTTYIGLLLGIDRGTIIQGKKELLALTELEQIPGGRQRRPGGGRKKKDSGAPDQKRAHGTH